MVVRGREGWSGACDMAEAPRGGVWECNNEGGRYRRRRCEVLAY